MIEQTAYLVEPGFIRAAGVGSSIRALFYEDGAIRIEHRCRVVDGVQLICAPALQLDGGHTVGAEDPLTVTPSIACPDCGLHGFITDGRWRPC